MGERVTIEGPSHGTLGPLGLLLARRRGGNAVHGEVGPFPFFPFLFSSSIFGSFLYSSWIQPIGDLGLGFRSVLLGFNRLGI